MCPACIATMAWIAAGATSTSGIAALVVRRLRGKKNKNNKAAMVLGAPAA